MMVLLMPASVTTADVVVNGASVGTVREVVASGPFEGFDGQTHVGTRWLPDDDRLPTDLPGPVTRNEAALLLLVLDAGVPEADAMKALRLGTHRVPASARVA